MFDRKGKSGQRRYSRPRSTQIQVTQNSGHRSCGNGFPCRPSWNPPRRSYPFAAAFGGSSDDRPAGEAHNSVAVCETQRDFNTDGILDRIQCTVQVVPFVAKHQTNKVNGHAGPIRNVFVRLFFVPDRLSRFSKGGMGQ